MGQSSTATYYLPECMLSVIWMCLGYAGHVFSVDSVSTLKKEGRVHKMAKQVKVPPTELGVGVPGLGLLRWN